MPTNKDLYNTDCMLLGYESCCTLGHTQPFTHLIAVYETNSFILTLKL